MSTLPVLKSTDKNGAIQYHLEFDPAWEGVESFAMYLQKKWGAEVIESSDSVYSRRWVLRLNGVPISVYHDSQIGNYFVREDGIADQLLMEKIEADLIERMS